MVFASVKYQFHYLSFQRKASVINSIAVVKILLP